MSLLFLSIPRRSSIFGRGTGFWGSLESDAVCDTRNHRLDVPRRPPMAGALKIETEPRSPRQGRRGQRTFPQTVHSHVGGHITGGCNASGVRLDWNWCGAAKRLEMRKGVADAGEALLVSGGPRLKEEVLSGWVLDGCSSGGKPTLRISDILSL
jgi:hypothetical protein